METKVYFLPWKKLHHFSDWLSSLDAFGYMKENDKIGIKIHFGEEGNKGFINPKTVKLIVDEIKKKNTNPFLTDANTIYVGKRADAVHHALVADKHGFNIQNCGCPIIIADGLRGNAGVEVEVGLKNFKNVNIANAIHYSDSLVFVSHFKGHEISGFGGTLKNIGMGCGTRAGKYAMHDSIQPAFKPENCTVCGNCVKWCPGGALALNNNKIVMFTDRCVGCGECILSCPSEVYSIPWNEDTSRVQEKIVEYAFGALKGKKSFSFNFLNYITKFCDCYPTKEKPLLDEIGIMASLDPVAIDQASADMVNKVFGSDFFKNIFPQIDWEVQLKYAEELGLGTRMYELVEYK